MLDIQLLRNNLPEVARRLAARGVTLDTDAFRALEDERRASSRTEEEEWLRGQAVARKGDGASEDAEEKCRRGEEK